jgi:hypothetical protein
MYKASTSVNRMVLCFVCCKTYFGMSSASLPTMTTPMMIGTPATSQGRVTDDHIFLDDCQPFDDRRRLPDVLRSSYAMDSFFGRRLLALHGIGSSMIAHLRALWRIIQRRGRSIDPVRRWPTR